MNGMQQTQGWTLMDVVPVILGPGQPGEPFVIQMGAGVNGWYYSVNQLGNPPIVEEAYKYGGFTNQFDELIPLWSTYCLDSVEFIYYPLNPGSG